MRHCRELRLAVDPVAMLALLALAAVFLLAVATKQNIGHFDPPAIVMVSAAFALVCVGALASFAPEREARARRFLPRAVIGLVALQLVMGIAGRPPAPCSTLAAAAYRLALAVALLLVASYALPLRVSSRLRLAALFVIYALVGAWAISASPAPFIDVWSFQQRAAALLLAGDNPYAASYTNIYAHVRFFAPEMLHGNEVQSFTYPPLSLLFMLPGYALLGDVRWSLLVATLAAAGLVVRALARAGLRAGDPLELCAVGILFHARGFLILDNAWTEPFLLLGVAGVLHGLVVQRRAFVGLWTGVTLAAKQYGLLLLPALLVARKLGWRELALGGLVAAVVTLPTFAWDPAAFWQGVVAFQFKLPPRSDSLSLSAMLMNWAGVSPPGAAGLLAALATLGAFAWRTWRHGAGGSCVELERAWLAAAAVNLAAFLIHKQAFVNYYWYAAGVLWMAVAAGAVGDARDDSRLASAAHLPPPVADSIA